LSITEGGMIEYNRRTIGAVAWGGVTVVLTLCGTLSQNLGCAMLAHRSPFPDSARARVAGLCIVASVHTPVRPFWEHAGAWHHMGAMTQQAPGAVGQGISQDHCGASPVAAAPLSQPMTTERQKQRPASMRYSSRASPQRMCPRRMASPSLHGPSMHGPSMHEPATHWPSMHGPFTYRSQTAALLACSHHRRRARTGVSDVGRSCRSLRIRLQLAQPRCQRPGRQLTHPSGTHKLPWQPQRCG
jgi:hypothetical protein